MTNSKIIAGLTGREVMDAIQADTPLAKVRTIFSAACGEIEQANLQRTPPSPIELRRMELQAANRICALFGGGWS